MSKPIFASTFLLILLYGFIQLRGFFLNDYSNTYHILQKSDIIKLTQEHPSMPGWQFQFISTIVNSYPAQKFDSIYISKNNYTQRDMIKLNKYYGEQYEFKYSDSSEKVSFDDSVFCKSYFLQRRYIAKWKIRGRNLIVQYGSCRL